MSTQPEDEAPTTLFEDVQVMGGPQEHDDKNVFRQREYPHELIEALTNEKMREEQRVREFATNQVNNGEHLDIVYGSVAEMLEDVDTLAKYIMTGKYPETPA